MKIGLKYEGLELEVEDSRVKYAVKGAWHHCKWDEFVELLARNFKPPKQVIDAP